MEQKYCLFHVSGDRDFIEGFEQLLIDNGIAYIKPDMKPHVEPRICRRGQVRRIAKSPRISSIPYEEWIKFIITVGAPILIDKAYEYYKDKKKKGNRILVETENEIVEVSAEKIRRVKVTKRRMTKRKGVIRK